MRPPTSLKAQALAFLARREHSRSELRGKLLAHARKQARAKAAATGPCEGNAGPDVAGTPEFDPEAAAKDIDRLLDELESAHHLSDARFAESRVHARALRQGTARIRQELARHGVALDADTEQHLRDTELERARAVWQRKFGGELAVDPAGRARQMRFLAGRGFSADVIRRIVGGRDDD